MSQERRRKILVIDDSNLSRNIIRETLEKSGFEVYLAESGEKGLAEVAARVPDLILLDVVMPGLSGWEACLRLKQAAPKKAVPIVIVTSKNAPQDMLHSFESGADEFLNKPVPPEDLVKMINRLLGSEKFKPEP